MRALSPHLRYQPVVGAAAVDHGDTRLLVAILAATARAQMALVAQWPLRRAVIVLHTGHVGTPHSLESVILVSNDKRAGKVSGCFTLAVRCACTLYNANNCRCVMCTITFYEALRSFDSRKASCAF